MNKRTVIFDSSVWIAYLLEKDKHHSQAVEIIRTYFRQEYIIYVPDIVFYEVISVLVKQKQYILAENLSKLELNITKLSNQEFLYLIFKYQNNFTAKTQDSLIIIHCLKYNVDCFETFDKKQKKNYDLITNL